MTPYTCMRKSPKSFTLIMISCIPVHVFIISTTNFLGAWGKVWLEGANAPPPLNETLSVSFIFLFFIPTSSSSSACPLSLSQSPGSTRSSRIYPVRRSTVVVQGEKLVIRKLVVAGIVSAEKSYLDCLNVMKEVRDYWGT